MTSLSPRLQLALEGEIREAYLKGIETGRKLERERIRKNPIADLVDHLTPQDTRLSRVEAQVGRAIDRLGEDTTPNQTNYLDVSCECGHVPKGGKHLCIPQDTTPNRTTP
jgi:hypothetical protein